MKPTAKESTTQETTPETPQSETGEQQVVVRPANVINAVSVDDVLARSSIVQDAMKRAMTVGVHYGTIPGCGKKPTLLKPGAELLGALFQLGHRYSVERMPLKDGHMMFSVACTIFYRPTGNDVDSGVGCCSTMEEKYASQTIDHTNRYGNLIKAKSVAEFYNTCLKMACKRALVAATLNATGVSSLFTQDIEDNPSIFQRDDNARKDDQGRPMPQRPQQAARSQNNDSYRRPQAPAAGPETWTVRLERVETKHFQAKDRDGKPVLKDGEPVLNEYFVFHFDDGRTASTFDTEIADSAIDGKMFLAGVKPGKKAGFWNLETLEPLESAPSEPEVEPGEEIEPAEL